MECENCFTMLFVIHVAPQLGGIRLSVTYPSPVRKGRKSDRSKEVCSPLNLAPEVLTAVSLGLTMTQHFLVSFCNPSWANNIE